MPVSQEQTLPDVPVMYVESPTGLAGAADAFDRLEAQLETLKGRKFYGTFQRPAGPYRACVALQPSDDAVALDLPTWTIPGGKYSREKLVNWSNDPPAIGRIFQRMAAEREPDPSRPSIEFYRSHEEVVLFLPIR
jgi:hypothetical protein